MDTLPPVAMLAIEREDHAISVTKAWASDGFSAGLEPGRYRTSRRRGAWERQGEWRTPVARGIETALSRIYPSGAVLIVDEKSARLLGRLDNSALHACAASIPAEGFNGKHILYPYHEEGSEQFYVPIIESGVGLVLAIDAGYPGKAGTLRILSVHSPIFAHAARSSRLAAYPATIRCDWIGHSGYVFESRDQARESIASDTIANIMAMNAIDVFWDKINPGLADPFMKLPKLFAYYGDGLVLGCYKQPSWRYLRDPYGALGKLSEVISWYIDLLQETPADNRIPLLAEAGLDGAGVVASNLNLPHEAHEIIKRLVSWSGITGEETRRHSGNRRRDGITGPAVLRFTHSPRPLSAHERLAISARLRRFLIDNAIADSDTAGRFAATRRSARSDPR